MLGIRPDTHAVSGEGSGGIGFQCVVGWACFVVQPTLDRSTDGERACSEPEYAKRQEWSNTEDV